jgi:hypothetical protein
MIIGAPGMKAEMHHIGLRGLYLFQPGEDFGMAK